MGHLHVHSSSLECQRQGRNWTAELLQTSPRLGHKHIYITLANQLFLLLHDNCWNSHVNPCKPNSKNDPKHDCCKWWSRDQQSTCNTNNAIKNTCHLLPKPSSTIEPYFSGVGATLCKVEPISMVCSTRPSSEETFATPFSATDKMAVWPLHQGQLSCKNTASRIMPSESYSIYRILNYTSRKIMFSKQWHKWHNRNLFLQTIDHIYGFKQQMLCTTWCHELRIFIIWNI